MAVSHPDTILAAYESVVQNEFNWLLLHYRSDSYEELSLLDHGFDGLDELKTKIYDRDQAFIAFYRQENDLDPGYVIINYIPPSIYGAKRARVQAHSRHVKTLFKKYYTTLTVDDLSRLSTITVHRALAEPESPQSTPMGRSFSQPTDKPNKPLPKPIVGPIDRRSFSETYAPHLFPRQPVMPMPTKSASMFTNILRRKKKTDDSSDDLDDMPPPTPPKDKGMFTVLQPQRRQGSAQALNSYSTPTQPQPIRQRQRSNSLAEFAILSHSFSSDEVIIEPLPKSSAPPQKDSAPPTYQSLPLRGKWAPDASSLDPEERARRRAEEKRQREWEEAEALREEQERQAEIKRQKEEMLRQETEEEEQRRASIDKELKRIAAERRRKEQLEKAEEERRYRELEERKRMERERRLEEHRRLEEWRNEQARLAEEAAARAEAEKKQEERERKKKIELVEAKVKRSANAEMLLTGWVTMQFNDSLVWKRRHYRFEGKKMYLYRSPKHTNQILDEITLRGQIRAFKEWHEGYEHLEAIPQSFVIEFKDERGAWSMFADSEEEKFKLLGLLHHAGGL